MFRTRRVALLLVTALLITQAVRVYAEDFIGKTVETDAAAITVGAPCAVLMESSTGTILYEKNGAERRSPASITKIMTLLLTFEAIEAGQISMSDEVLVSAHAASMGGSQVFLEEGETQTLETMIKCIAVASGNDASVAVAEHIAGSEEAFVERMNAKALELGMTDTHFMDCCGLTDSAEHFSCARDVAIMSKELTVKYPEIFRFSNIWMEDITHHTRRGDSLFTLSSTNKLLKQYNYCTGLKTGFTSKAGFCVSATAARDGVELIAVIMGAPDSKQRNNDAKALLTYGFGSCKVYRDTDRKELCPMTVEGGMADTVDVMYLREFTYLDTEGKNLGEIRSEIKLPESICAPVKTGDEIGQACYYLGDVEIGVVPIVCLGDVERASFGYTFVKVLRFLLF